MKLGKQGRLTRKVEIERSLAASEAARDRRRLSWRGLCASALALFFLLALSATASAGPPVHVQTEDHPLAGATFDHACGTAVDVAGNIYVSSAGENRVEVFDSSGSPLTSIANTNEPCGLAVNSQGALYVSEKETGKVVRYVPNEPPPFAGAPSYGAVSEIDGSGEAAGIGVDRVDDRLYVARADRIAVYQANGVPEPVSNEVQQVRVVDPTGGTYTLGFRGETTDPLEYNATSAEVQEELEDLSTIGVGNVSVTEQASGDVARHIVTFAGVLQNKTLPQLVGGSKNLVGASSGLIITTQEQGFSGYIGENDLSEALGIAAYTYQITASLSTRYLYVADALNDEVKVFSGSSFREMKMRRTIANVDHDSDPDTPAQDLEFGVGGAYLAVDPGNRNFATKGCSKVGNQACTAGHLLVYNDNSLSESLEEFDATGRFLDRIESPELDDAEPTAMAIDRSGGPNDGLVYVTAGDGAGARILAFKPLVTPGRALLDGTPPGEPSLSKVLGGANAAAVDPFGNLYVGSGPIVHIFDPDGNPLTTFEDSLLVFELAVDSECNVYVSDGSGSNRQVSYYDASACPPSAGTSFARHVPPLVSPTSSRTKISVNPANDHLFVHSEVSGSTFSKPIAEFAKVKDGSAKLRECGGVISGNFIDMAVFGGEGEDNTRVYLSRNPRTLIALDCGEEEGLEEIRAETRDGGGCSSGEINANAHIAVDQSNGHLLALRPGQAGGVREYDAALSCVAEFGTFVSDSGQFCCSLAIDNGPNSPNQGVAYVAYDGANNAVQPFDVTAFGPLSYGQVPVAATGIASNIGDGAATLNGTVDPRETELASCKFEYLLDSVYRQNLEEEDPAFEGAASVPCAETPIEIGAENGAVPVHADLAGLDPDEPYRFRLVAENEFGQSVGKTQVFGRPVGGGEKALPVFYDEATLRASLNPNGLTTQYRFEYGTTEAYGQNTPTATLPPGDNAVAVRVLLAGLVQGTEYHFRLVATNEAGEYEGPSLTFETLQRLQVRSCPNTEFRVGLSAKLPDCRAYELVTPADVRGAEPGASTPPGAGSMFNNWLVSPRGPVAGESVGYFSGTLPGFEGTGEADGYRAIRGSGPHPSEGWQTDAYGPTYAQLGGATGNLQEGVSADQRYWLWNRSGEVFPALLPLGHYLRVPLGEANRDCNINPETFQDEFELVGCGSLGADPQAISRFVSPGGENIVFFSNKQLEPEAAPDGTRSIYDRKAGKAEAKVVSLDPEGNPFGSNATYVGASENGSTILFAVAGTLYAHRNGQTVEVIAGPHSFAGVSEDGSRVFYTNAAFTEIAPPAPADLIVCDLDEVGPCPDPDEGFASEAIPVGVSPDGTGAFFISENNLGPGEENENGEEALEGQSNLYAYDGELTRFVGILDSEDLDSFGGQNTVDFLAWLKSINPNPSVGRANTPTRATPGGDVFLFQSHARLTAYDNDGHGQIYRFAPGAPSGERLLCISCNPTGAPASGDAMFQIYAGDKGGSTIDTTMVLNVTDDGTAVFFNSPDRLMPEDANDVIDVYQWKAKGAGVGSEQCKRSGGCLSLVSSGQGESQSTIYGMTADGRDVFFSTSEKLVGPDRPGSSSIYDARVEGGIPDPPVPAPCQGDACQGEGTLPPGLPVPASSAPLGNGNVPSPQVSPKPTKRCGKGKRAVRRKGKVQCVKKQAKKKTRAKKKRRAGARATGPNRRGASNR